VTVLTFLFGRVNLEVFCGHLAATVGGAGPTIIKWMKEKYNLQPQQITKTSNRKPQLTAMSVE